MSPVDFPDETALECSANKLRMETMLDARLVRSCPLLLLTAGLLTAQVVSSALARYGDRFNVILSYDGEGCAVRFHKIRDGQRWLAEDLEGYVDEGVLVFEAGEQRPVPQRPAGNELAARPAGGAVEEDWRPVVRRISGIIRSVAHQLLGPPATGPRG